MPTKVIAASLALVAFALAILLGLFAGNTAATTIGRALIVMVVCYLVGQLIGYVGRTAMTEHVERYKRDHPMPESDFGIEKGEPVEDPAGPQSQDASGEPGRQAAGRAA